jgi:hypothetical protein
MLISSSPQASQSAPIRRNLPRKVTVKRALSRSSSRRGVTGRGVSARISTNRALPTASDNKSRIQAAKSGEVTINDLISQTSALAKSWATFGQQNEDSIQELRNATARDEQEIGDLKLQIQNLEVRLAIAEQNGYVEEMEYRLDRLQQFEEEATQELQYLSHENDDLKDEITRLQSGSSDNAVSKSSGGSCIIDGMMYKVLEGVNNGFLQSADGEPFRQGGTWYTKCTLLQPYFSFDNVLGDEIEGIGERIIKIAGFDGQSLETTLVDTGKIVSKDGRSWTVLSMTKQLY